MNKKSLPNQIKITIDKKLINTYYKEYYFKKYPRAKKKYITVIYPSLNQWMILNNMARNTLKQKWKEFGIWIVKYYGLENKKITNYKLTYIFYFPTKRRHDLDNYTPKFLNDGLVEGGLLIDDDYKHMTGGLHLKSGGHDKKHPRTEILIEYW